MPRVAVVIPCYNDGATVGETVASVLDQEATELVVVDDGSTDPETQRVMERLQGDGVRVLRQANAGAPAARMAGVKVTSAPLVLPLDADDALLPGAVAALADALESNRGAVAAWGDMQFFGDASAVVPSARRIDPWRSTFVNELPTMGLFRREALLGVGGWTLTEGYEDWEVWLAFAERGWDGVHVQRPVARYRVHGNRLWSEHASRHDAIVQEIRRRHSSLFERRDQNRRGSRSSALVKVALPRIERSPFSPRTRIALANIVTRPRSTLQLMLGVRLSRGRRRLARLRLLGG